MQCSPKSPRRSTAGEGGFTLIEVMIVVVIVAILATIAYPSYQDQVMRSRRSAAAVCLQERAQFMERYYTTQLTYVGAPDPAQCDGSVARFYQVQARGVTARAYTLDAVPQGAQAARDTKCATLSTNQRGERSASGTAGAGECW
ncbi:type IV pilin protein [Lysobacter sp. A03]|uniref:type IV pilin protein n=1 Tax=Lysobacter sp. A03 TaxID=1199154 RepID=UPI0005C779AF|nr:type IV pilin protein [Lysobacter sp. A03]